MDDFDVRQRRADAFARRIADGLDNLARERDASDFNSPRGQTRARIRRKLLSMFVSATPFDGVRLGTMAELMFPELDDPHVLPLRKEHLRMVFWQAVNDIVETTIIEVERVSLGGLPEEPWTFLTEGTAERIEEYLRNVE